MQLTTSNLILHYFPPDLASDVNDVPRYALQPKDQKSYETLPLTLTDHLIITEDAGIAQLKLSDNLIGTIPVDSKEKKDEISNFVKNWDRGLELLDNPKDTPQDNKIIGSLRKRLSGQKQSLIVERELDIRIVSWNLHGDPVYDSETEDFSKLLRDDVGTSPDIIFVCFQETIPLNAKNLSSSSERVQNWEKTLLARLPPTYQKVKSNRLLGLTLIVLAKDSLVPQINSIATSTIGTGLLGVWANKGAIVLSFKIGFDDMCDLEGFDLQIFNCHLASGHGREMLEHRRKELYDIQRKFKIVGNGKLLNEDWVSDDDAEYEKYLYYDEISEMANELEIKDGSDDSYDGGEDEEDEEEEVEEDKKVEYGNPLAKGITFFCGDLNYRIFMERTHVQQCLEAEDYTTLLSFDGLTQERKAHKVFLNFNEGEINFKPTYKFNSDGGYEFNRIPSYCDRILYTPHSSIKQESYEPLYDFLASDHKPIVSNFKLKANLVDFERKSQIVTAYFKEQDKLENESRPAVEITRQDIPMVENHFLIPNETDTVLKNNSDKASLSWEILLLENNDPTGIVSIDPMSGDLAPGGQKRIKITGVLPIGVKDYSNTSILRVHNAQDFFISYSFKSKPSIFGLDLSELSAKGSGIPKAIYQAVNFLSEHNYQGMFEDDISRLNKIDYKLIRDLDEERDLDLEYLDTQLMIDAIKSVARMLLLILTNLPRGVVSSEYSVRLINHFYKKREGSSGNGGGGKNMIKSGGTEEVVLYLMEILPSLNANLLIFLINFLKILIKDYRFNRDKLVKQFQNILFQIPSKLSKRKMVTDSNVRNLKKRRTELLLKLLQ